MKDVVCCGKNLKLHLHEKILEKLAYWIHAKIKLKMQIEWEAMTTQEGSHVPFGFFFYA
jgi:hypothetical protein